LPSRPLLQLLAFHQDASFKIAREARGPWFKGPAHACHPEHLELCLIERGREHVLSGRFEGVQGAGSYSLVAPGTVHSSWTERAGVQECILHLPVAQLAETAAELGVRDYLRWPQGSFATPAPMAALTQTLMHELMSPPTVGRALLLRSAFTQLAVLLLRAHHVHKVRPLPVLGGSPLRHLERAEEAMRAELGGEHSLEALAADAGMSSFAFLRAFKKRFGAPPHAYLVNLRVERASELMLATDLSLTEIAFDVGFGSGSRLTEAHKQRFGETPARWREARRATFGRASRKDPGSGGDGAR